MQLTCNRQPLEISFGEIGNLETNAQLRTAADYKDIVVKASDGNVVRLSAVGERVHLGSIPIVVRGGPPTGRW